MDLVNIALALVLVAANGFFVATEFAVARLRPGQVDAWGKDGKPGSKSVKHAVDHIDAYLAACQLGITISSSIITLLHVVVGELAPRAWRSRARSRSRSSSHRWGASSTC